MGLRNPHNSHLGVLARMGWIGAGLWAAVWFSWFAEIRRARGKLRRNGEHRLFAITTWASVSSVAILINAIFDPTLEGPQVAFWLWGFLGVGLAVAAISRVPALRTTDSNEPSGWRIKR